MGALRKVLAVAGLALVAAAALAGVALSALVAWARTPTGRAQVAAAAVGVVDRELAGHFRLGGVAVLSGGGVEIQDLEVFDPDDVLVLSVTRARVEADVTRLRGGILALAIELEGPYVMLDEEADGGLSLLRAFASAHPSPAPGGPGWEPSFTLRVNRLRVRGGAVWWRDRRGNTVLEARDIAIDARGALGPRDADLDLRLGAALDTPVEAPLSVEARASRRGAAAVLSALRVSLGASAISAVGEGDIERRSGRIAMTRIAIGREEARALIARAGRGADLAATAFLGSDGSLATAALSVSPEAPGGGSAEIAMAARLAGPRAAGLDVVMDGLDPSRVLDVLPRGSLTLSARGAAAGHSQEDLRGRLEAHLGRSTLRGVELGPGDARARAGDGEVEVQRLALTAPGVNVEASGRAVRGGALEGRAVVDAADLGATALALRALLGQPLPAMAGSLRLGATLQGTQAVPELEAALASPSVAVENLSLRHLSGTLSAGGPRGARRGTFEIKAESLHADGREMARALSARGSLADGEASADASASVPALGAERVSASASGKLDTADERFALAALAISWPGARWSLAAPAVIDLSGPAVDRLDLASGEEHVVAEGGLEPGGRVDARVRLVQLDLEHLPRGLLPAGTAGRVDADARARGSARRPSAEVRLSVAGGAVAGLTGLSGSAELGWDGEGRRARLALEALRKEGGHAEVSGEIPLPLAGRPSEPLALRLNATALPLAEVLTAALGEDPGLEGRVGLDARVSGTVSVPSLHASATLSDGAWEEFSPLSGSVEVDAPGERLSVTASLSVSGRRALDLDAGLPLELGEIVARPGPAMEALLRAPIHVTATVPGLELSALAATPGLPRDLTGVLDALAEIEGSLAAPRGTVTAQVSRLGLEGYQDLAGRAEVRLLADRVESSVDGSMAGSDLLHATGSLGRAPEALVREGALSRAPVRLEATMPRVDLSRASSANVALAGTVEGRLSASGTAADPQLQASATGAGLVVGGRSLGGLEVEARHERGRTTARLALRPTSGGSLAVTASLDAPVGLGARVDLARAPLEARLVAEALDIGFLPAVAPGVMRFAEGKLSADVTVRGPLGRPHPLGRIRLEGGRVAVAEYGDWTAIGADVEVDDDALELRRFEARRGRGKFSVTGSARGLAGESARVQASASFDKLTVARAGMDFATVTLALDAEGTYRASGLDLEVHMRDRGAIVLPKRIPRTLQSLERRPDIAVGRVRERRRPVLAAVPAARPAAAPFRTAVHLVVPGRLVVKGDEPKVDLDLKADVKYELAGGEEQATGDLETVRGFVEPLGGRRFEVTRGRVQFTGGAPKTALVDVEAHWNGAQDTEVTVVVSGAAANPQIKLSSKPALDDSQIALLIATGRTELKRGGGDVGSLSTQEAGYAAASALVTTAFKTMLSDKLPFDSFSVDSRTVRAGTYLGRIYVGYVYRFDAKVEAGENQNEWSAEYSITKGWTLESRYGDAGSGSASLIWSKDY